MSAWVKVQRVDGPPAGQLPLVTLHREAFALSASFVRQRDLGVQTRVSLLLDHEARKVGLRFHSDDKDRDSYALASAGRQTNGRMIYAGGLIARTAWLLAATKLGDRRLRQYEPSWLPDKSVWSISIRPSFEIRVRSKAEVPSGLSGIYRYLSKNQVVYIGRGVIRTRASSPERADWEFDAIEYSVIESTSEQVRWEAEWLEDHRNNFGALPLYNRISGFRSSSGSETEELPESNESQ